jgi:DNA gyrase/topoisomerase IV subunit A
VQGFGKRVAVDEFQVQRRGGKGNIAIKLRDGDTLVDFHPVSGSTNGAGQGVCTVPSTINVQRLKVGMTTMC